MSAIHPIGQRVSCLEGLAPADFVRKARELLADNEDVVLETPSEDELTILAQSEVDLEAPRRLLSAIFGNALRFSPPAARLLYADGWQQPIMGFRIATSANLLALVETSLALRSASITNIEVQDASAVIRGHAPQTALIGYPDVLSRLSRGAAHATLWLRGYESLWSYSPENTVCHQE